MKKKRSSQLFGSYLQMHWKGFLLFAGFCLVEAVVLDCTICQGRQSDMRQRFVPFLEAYLF